MNSMVTVDRIAEEIYRFSADTPGEFGAQGKSCKAFYRKIARWHISRMMALERMLMRPIRKALKGAK